MEAPNSAIRPNELIDQEQWTLKGIVKENHQSALVTATSDKTIHQEVITFGFQGSAAIQKPLIASINARCHLDW